MEPELIVLLNKHGQPIGSAPKLESHHSNTPFHLAFSCYIFNSQGQFLLTQRSKSKKVWPGVWTGSVCGHPAPGESMLNAINRRVDFELGMPPVTEITELLADYRYKTPPFKGIVEHELCPIFFAMSDVEPRPNAQEVAVHQWVSWQNLLQGLEAKTRIYSYWMIDQVKRIRDHPRILRATSQDNSD